MGAEHRPRRWAAGALAALVALGAATGCASDADPAAQARHHLRNRLAATTTRAQARCVVGQLSDDAAIALDRDVDLPANSAAMRAYSDAMVACIAGL